MCVLGRKMKKLKAGLLGTIGLEFVELRADGVAIPLGHKKTVGILDREPQRF